MAHRRRSHRRARANPISANAKIGIAVGITALLVGGGIYLYKRQSTTTGGGGGGNGQLPGGNGQLPPGSDAAKALDAARLKFGTLIGAKADNEVYAFQMAIGAVQAAGIRAEDVIGIATSAVVAYYTANGMALAKAQEYANFVRDESGFGPQGAAGAAAIAEQIRKAKYGSGPSFDA